MKNGIERVSPVVLHRPDMFSGSPVAESHESSRVRIPLFLPAAPSIAEQSCVLVLVHVSVNARASEISKKFFVLVFTLSLSLSLSVCLSASPPMRRRFESPNARSPNARSLDRSLILSFSYSLACLCRHSTHTDMSLKKAYCAMRWKEREGHAGD